MQGRHRGEQFDYTPDRAGQWDPDASLRDAFEDFMDASAGILSDATAAKYRWDFEHFEKWLNEQGHSLTLSSLVSRRITAGYAAALRKQPNKKGARSGRATLSSHTIHSYMRVLRTLARFLVGEDRLPKDPFYGPRSPLPHLGDRRPADKAASMEDLRALLGGTEGAAPLAIRDRMIMTLDVDTGIRTGELAELMLREVDLERRTVHVHESKWGGSRDLPISRDAVGAIRRYLRSARPRLTGLPAELTMPNAPLVVSDRGRGLTPSGIYQAMCEAHRRGGGSGVLGLHAIRHFWATYTRDRNMPSWAAKEILGHSSIAVTEGYQSRPSVEQLRPLHAAATPVQALRGRRSGGQMRPHLWAVSDSDA